MEHFENIEKLTEREREILFEQAKQLDIKNLNDIFHKTINKKNNKKIFLPPKSTVELKKYFYDDIGLDLIKKNKVATLILAGGSGTRLGFNLPKGMFVCETINKSLFQIHIENLLKMQQENYIKIPLVIMTSDATHNDTIKYFKENNNFGLNSCDIYFFMQNSIPAFTLNGKIILETKNKICMSANGNGDIYNSLITSGVYEKLTSRGVKYLQVTNIDNILSKIIDCNFIGLVSHLNVELGVKAISKTSDFENVGVFCEVDNNLEVVEYSELDKDLASKKTTCGERLFDCANMSSYVFDLDALYSHTINNTLDYHIATKNIKTDFGVIQGIKLELFIFDLFKYFNSYIVAKVDRNSEFSPIKNKSGESSPETAIKDYLKINSKI